MSAADLHKADWQALAADIGLSGASTVRRVAELAELVAARCEDVALQITDLAGDPARILERDYTSIQMRCRRIQAQSR